MLKTWGFALVISGGLMAGCAGGGDRYKLPPPLETQALPTARGTVYAPPGAQPSNNPTGYCITSAGYCSLAAPAETGLPCLCDSASPKVSYGGKTGAIPPMPEWADPALLPK